jgi:hypothetical protein
VAVKDQRIRVYVLEDVGEDGAVNQMYVRQPSEKDDQGYWGGLACVEVGADEAVLVTWRGTESKPVLTDATACRLIAEVVASTLPAGAYLACR